MRRSAIWAAPALSAVGLLAAGCSDLGTCDDPAKGRTTVKFGGQLMYTGQAVMLSSCANNICHSSKARGSVRQGAPAGLDFDLKPIASGSPIVADGGIVAVQVDALEAAGLRVRQRKVFEEREEIWEQVDKGLMPPEDAFKNLMSLARSMFSSDGSCPEIGSLSNLDGVRNELRNWLACGTPIVETNSAQLPFAAPATNADGADKAAGAASYAGATGYQYPECKIGGGDGGTGPAFKDVYDRVFTGEGCSATNCHGPPNPTNGFDLSTIDKAYTTLLGANGQGAPQACGATNMDPYVKPGDPDGSYLMAKVKASTKPVCGTYMPSVRDTGVSAASADLLRQWIAAGAMRP